MKRTVFIMTISMIMTICSCTAQSAAVPLTETPIPDNQLSPSLRLTEPLKSSPTIPAAKSPTGLFKTPPKMELTCTKTPLASLTLAAAQPSKSMTAEATGLPGTPAKNTSDEWQELPVIPKISDQMVQVYLHGLEIGNNPQSFSKIGDCGSTPAWFLGDFDRGERYYSLGEYGYLQAVIDYFQGSFGRTSLAARSGFNVSALFVPLWADRTYCQSDEAPLVCEFRNQKPIIAFIMLGSNDVWHPEEFEPQMRRLIEHSLEHGVIPILSTKADNQEGDGSINATIARLAFEYDVPLWNFWRAVNDLPGNGLQEDQVHLTWGANFFDRPESLQLAWPIRNLTALQVLDAVWEKITRQ